MIVVKSGYFCAAVVLSSAGVVQRAAPILKYMRGWPSARVLSYARSKGWQTTVQ